MHFLYYWMSGLCTTQPYTVFLLLITVSVFDYRKRKVINQIEASRYYVLIQIALEAHRLVNG